MGSGRKSVMKSIEKRTVRYWLADHMGASLMVGMTFNAHSLRLDYVELVHDLP